MDLTETLNELEALRRRELSLNTARADEIMRQCVATLREDGGQISGQVEAGWRARTLAALDAAVNAQCNQARQRLLSSSEIAEAAIQRVMKSAR